jgi:hypothetical protein
MSWSQKAAKNGTKGQMLYPWIAKRVQSQKA